MRAAAIALFLMLSLAALDAHVTVWPRESPTGAGERYTVRVPTEGQVATTSVDLEVPEGVQVETLLAPAGWKYETKRQGDRILAITWQMEVKPGEFVEYGFVARNPRDQTQIVWKLRQHFADGTTTDWTAGPNGTYPTAVTRLNPVAKQ